MIPVLIKLVDATMNDMHGHEVLFRPLSVADKAKVLRFPTGLSLVSFTDFNKYIRRSTWYICLDQ
jgi:hypothetical protein